MGSKKKISFDYIVDGTFVHYSCKDLRDLELVCEKTHRLAPRYNSRISNPRYRGLKFKTEPNTVFLLISCLKENNFTLIKNSDRTYSHNYYERKDIYTLDEVFSEVIDVEETKDFWKEWNGEKVAMNHAKYHIFKNNPKCVCCGLEGRYLALERSLNSSEETLFHFNMYGLDENGGEVLFTKDHIKPKSKGGPNTVENYQTMCVRCNAEKGDREISIEDLRKEVLRKEIQVSEQLY